MLTGPCKDHLSFKSTVNSKIVGDKEAILFHSSFFLESMDKLVNWQFFCGIGALGLVFS